MTDWTLTNRSLAVGRLWRPIGFTASYPVFALGCCLLALAAPLIAILSPDRQIRIRRMRHGACLTARAYLTLCRALQLIDVQYINAAPLPGGLIVANHPSLVDAFWVMATQPDLCCVLKGDLQRFKVLQLLVRQLGYVSNRDPERLLEEGCERLQAGETLLVFPEATRTLPGAPVEFRVGAAELALRAGVPIHPVVIRKQGRYLSKQCPWYDFPPDKLRWTLEFRAALPVVREATNRRAARRQLTRELEGYFRRSLSEASLAHEGIHAEN